MRLRPERKKVRVAAALLAAGFATSPAQATGTLSCDSRAPVKVEALGSLSAGMGDRLLDFRAAVDAASEDTGQDLSRRVFTRSEVSQWWLDEESLRLRLYWEREGDGPFGTSEITLVATARPGDEGVFAGTVKIAIFDTTAGREVRRQAESTIECTVE